MVTINDPNQPRGPVKVSDGNALFVDGSSGLDRFEALASYDMYAASAMGLIAGVYTVNKFGRNPDVDTGVALPELVWPLGGDYPYQAVAVALEVVSGSGLDISPAGTGMREIVIEGLDANWVQQSATVTMNGLGIVQVAGLTWLRVFRAYGTEAGTGLTNAGLITVRVTGAGAAQAVISVSDGQTYQTLYTVPVGKTAMIEDWRCEVTDANNTVFGEAALFTRFNDQADRPWRSRMTKGIVSGDAHELHAPIIVPEKTDIECRVTDISASNTSVIATFTLIVFDNAPA